MAILCEGLGPCEEVVITFETNILSTITPEFLLWVMFAFGFVIGATLFEAFQFLRWAIECLLRCRKSRREM